MLGWMGKNWQPRRSLAKAKSARSSKVFECKPLPWSTILIFWSLSDLIFPFFLSLAEYSFLYFCFTSRIDQFSHNCLLVHSNKPDVGQSCESSFHVLFLIFFFFEGITESFFKLHEPTFQNCALLFWEKGSGFNNSN